MPRVYNRNKSVQVSTGKRYVTKNEALEILGISRETFRKYQKNNEIAPIGKKLNANLYSMNDVIRLNNKVIEII